MRQTYRNRQVRGPASSDAKERVRKEPHPGTCPSLSTKVVCGRLSKSLSSCFVRNMSPFGQYSSSPFLIIIKQMIARSIDITYPKAFARDAIGTFRADLKLIPHTAAHLWAVQPPADCASLSNSSDCRSRRCLSIGLTILAACRRHFSASLRNASALSVMTEYAV